MRTDVTRERSSWRDLSLSRRHREWGIDCPATDIDCLVEIARGVPAALVEYKKAGADIVRSYQSWKALYLLADRARLPFFLVRYSCDPWRFSIATANSIGWDAVSRITGLKTLREVEFDELAYVRFLYSIRERNPDMADALPVFSSRP